MVRGLRRPLGPCWRPPRSTSTAAARDPAATSPMDSARLYAKTSVRAPGFAMPGLARRPHAACSPPSRPS